MFLLLSTKNSGLSSSTSIGRSLLPYIPVLVVLVVELYLVGESCCCWLTINWDSCVASERRGRPRDYNTDQVIRQRMRRENWEAAHNQRICCNSHSSVPFFHILCGMDMKRNTVTRDLVFGLVGQFLCVIFVHFKEIE